MSRTAVTVHGDATSLLCYGSVTDGSRIGVDGNVTSLYIAQGVSGGSLVDVTGAVKYASIYGAAGGASVDSTSTVRFGSLTQSLYLSGDLAGTVDITGSAAGSSISVSGNLTGKLLAGTFGNVSVYGKLSGQIGDAGTSAGSGNSLYVSQPGGGGTVNPGNAFATYYGYP